MARPMAFWRQVVLSTLALGLAASIWYLPDSLRSKIPFIGASPASGQEQRTRSSATPVIASPVGRATDDVAVEVVGTGRARRSVTLRSEDAGRIVSLALEANRDFAAGDVLLMLDDAEERIALQLAETRLAEAERVRNRVSDLLDRGVAPDARVSEVETTAELARLEMEQARQALDDRVLRAPFDGTSGLPMVDEGAWIDSDSDIASFDDRSVLLVEVDLPQSLISRVRTGIGVVARTPSVPGRTFEGTVSAIDSRVDAQSRTARVRVAIPNGDDALRPGTSFSIRLDLPGPEYFVVPELALQFAREGLHVWRITDGTAERVPVRLVRRRDGMVLVDGLLAVDDPVVVEGTQRLRNGREVEIIGKRDGETV